MIAKNAEALIGMINEIKENTQDPQYNLGDI
jgi:hypothetical protein